MTAVLTHYGHWVQPPRRQAQGPAPKPRWLPLPGLLYAQVVQTVRRWRLVRVSHRVVFGSLEAVKHILAPLVRIPVEGCHGFRPKPATDSRRRLPRIPAETCHRFQAKVATDSD